MAVAGQKSEHHFGYWHDELSISSIKKFHTLSSPRPKDQLDLMQLTLA